MTLECIYYLVREMDGLYAFMIGVMIGAAMMLMCFWLLSMMFYDEEDEDDV